MKKVVLFFAVSAAVALASCSGSEENKCNNATDSTCCAAADSVVATVVDSVAATEAAPVDSAIAAAETVADVVEAIESAVEAK